MSSRTLVPKGPEPIEERVRSGQCFWLDILGPGEDDLALLRETFGFHELAVEDSEHFEQRPKIEEYDHFVFLVVYGPSPDEDGLVEVHCFYSENYLVTVRRDDSPTLDSLLARFDHDPRLFPRAPRLLYELLDRLVDDFFPVLDYLDNRLALIDEHMFFAPKPEHLEDIFRMKSRLVRLRRIVAPQRDVLARLTGAGSELPGATVEDERYFRDVYDHLVRLAEEIDGDRELANSAIDAYLSTASNRLNATTKQLTVIATIFLPLSFLTGFFGQNFAWMVDEVSSLQAFLLLGLGLEVLMVIALLVLFRVRGWF